MKNKKKIFNALLLLILLDSANQIQAGPRSLEIKSYETDFDRQHWKYVNPSSASAKSTSYNVPLNKSRFITLSGSLKHALKGNSYYIDKGNPTIATTRLFNSDQLFIQGKKLGTTNVVISDANNKISQIFNIEVTHDLESLKAKLYEILPSEQILVRSAQKNIILSGEVSGLDVMQAAIDIAQSYLGSSESKSIKGGAEGHQNQSESTNVKNEEKSKGDVPHIINLMSVGGAQQVMLEVTIAEIDRKLFRGLDIKYNTLHSSNNFSWGALNGGGSLIPAPPLSGGNIAGPLSSLFTPNAHSVDAAGLFLSGISGSYMFNLTIDAAQNQNLAKILAEPVLTTLSGQEATFISGGEFPIPVPQTSGNNGGSITIVFKEFGVTTRFLPVVLDSGRINLNMNIGVSELSEDAAIFAAVGGVNTAFTIPSLTKREASSTLELADGQTMSIAGLISDKVRSNVDKFPGLGDIPVLGALFRSEQFIKERTELVIFVTPHLAKPMLAKDIRRPTDSYVEPDDLDFYILGRLESRNANSSIADNLNFNDSNGGLEGQFGHQLIEQDNTQ